MSVELKKRRRRAPRRGVILVLLAVLVAGTALVLINLRQPVNQDDIPDAVTYGEILAHEEDEVRRITVTRKGEEPWTILRGEDGGFTLEGEDGFVVSDSKVSTLTAAAAVISYDDILSEDPAEYRDHLADFGLDPAEITAEFEYTDGTSAKITIGNGSGFDDETWYYMLLEGDDRLLALDKGTRDNLNVARENLHPVEQPELHKARIDMISWTDETGETVARWEMTSAITDADANLAWVMTLPRQYPADSESLDNLKSNLVNIRFGAYVGEATPENLTRYGFDTPRSVLTVHMAAGTVNATDDSGSVVPTDYPESTFTLTVGGAKNDNVDYVLHEGSIYVSSRFTLETFMNMDPMNTLSRYPVTVPLSDLRQLTIRKDGQERVYSLSRDTETGEDGEETTVTTVEENGEEFSYDAFEAAYARLENVTVSGVLPEGWERTGEDHTVFTFLTEEGKEHTVALTDFDALHDAVVVDGSAVFYLIKEGFTWETGE